jgi:CubicO group peptidase (beta-lactamase class C family)
MTELFKLPFAGSAIVYAPARAYDPKALPSGGVGILGAARDYLRFVEAIRKGAAGVIRPETAAAMTRNAVGDFVVGAAGPGFGWGHGVAILKNPAAAKPPPPQCRCMELGGRIRYPLLGRPCGEPLRQSSDQYSGRWDNARVSVGLTTRGLRGVRCADE